MGSSSGNGPSERDYQKLAEMRVRIREYLAWAEGNARQRGLTPTQVQFALAVRAHDNPDGPTVTELAETLLLRHHSVVGLIDRTERAGLVRRERDAVNGSVVHVVLTDEGAEQLDELMQLHLDWLVANGGELAQAWSAFERDGA
jgi:DNA-binding MarR family transcriptional regulator